MLLRNRNDLLFALEESWALIGWELQQAETPADIRSALQRIQGINCSSLEYYCNPYRREITSHQLHEVRKRLQKVSDKLREAYFNWQKCKDSAELAQSALSQTRDEGEHAQLRTICQTVDTSLAAATKTLQQLQNRQTLLDRALRQREAAFAQSELLEFIRNDRYASTPLNFANAMAGPPAIHWRQSMIRCVGFHDGASHGLTYKRFQILTEVFKQPSTNAEEAIEQMKARLLQAKGQDVIPLNALAENWYLLRCAIEAAFHAERPPKETLPYRVFAEYQRRYGCQSHLDMLLIERESLTTPTFVKERRRVGKR